MCGIVGYLGKRKKVLEIVETLNHLEQIWDEYDVYEKQVEK